jgi:hypothetical protein
VIRRGENEHHARAVVVGVGGGAGRHATAGVSERRTVVRQVSL